MEKRIYYLSNTVIPNTKQEKNLHVFNVLTQVGVKQLTDFLHTVTTASDLVDCTLVNCVMGWSPQCYIPSFPQGYIPSFLEIRPPVPEKMVAILVM